MSRIALALVAAVAVVAAAAVAAFLWGSAIDARGIPQGTSVWTGTFTCAKHGTTTKPEVVQNDLSLVVLRSGGALAATFMSSSKLEESGLRMTGVVSAAGDVGLVPGEWLVKSPRAVALQLHGRVYPWSEAILVHLDGADVDCDDVTLTRATAVSLLAPGDSQWSGGYMCQQGATHLELVVDQGPTGNVDAVFAFSPAAENPGIPSGSFHMKGYLDPVKARVVLAAGDWIERPPGWVTVGLRGTLTTGASTLAGDVRIGNIGAVASVPDGCTSFTVANVRGAVP